MSTQTETEAQVIIQPTNNDIIMGRAGVTRSHPGNIQYRKLVEAKKSEYVAAMKRDKRKISVSIVDEVRRLGGRFLDKDNNNGDWYDIGDIKAINKVSQALRENQPYLRDAMERDLHPRETNTQNGDDDTSLPEGRRVSLIMPHIEPIPVDRLDESSDESISDWASVMKTIRESARQLDVDSMDVDVSDIDTGHVAEVVSSNNNTRVSSSMGFRTRRRSSFPPRKLSVTSKYARIERVAYQDIKQDDLSGTKFSVSPNPSRERICFQNYPGSNRNSCFSSSSGSTKKRMSDLSIMSGIDLGEFELGSVDDSSNGLRSSLINHDSDTDNKTFMNDADMGEIINLFGEDPVAQVIPESTTTTTTYPSIRQSRMSRRSVQFVKNYLSMNPGTFY